LEEFEHTRDRDDIRFGIQEKQVLRERIAGIGIAEVVSARIGNAADKQRVVGAVELRRHTFHHLIRVVDQGAFVAAVVEPLVFLNGPTGVDAELFRLERIQLFVVRVGSEDRAGSNRVRPPKPPVEQATPVVALIESEQWAANGIFVPAET